MSIWFLDYNYLRVLSYWCARALQRSRGDFGLVDFARTLIPHGLDSVVSLGPVFSLGLSLGFNLNGLRFYSCP